MLLPIELLGQGSILYLIDKWTDLNKKTSETIQRALAEESRTENSLAYSSGKIIYGPRGVCAEKKFCTIILFCSITNLLILTIIFS